MLGLNIIAKFKAFALSIATNHNTFLQVHCSITFNSLRSAHALPCAADLPDPGLVHTFPYYWFFFSRASLMVWFKATFELLPVCQSDLIGTAGLWECIWKPWKSKFSLFSANLGGCRKIATNPFETIWWFLFPEWQWLPPVMSVFKARTHRF